MRKLILVCTILVLGAVTAGKAQVISATPPAQDPKKSEIVLKQQQQGQTMTKADEEKLKLEQEQQNGGIVVKSASHAPDPNAPDYDAKKAEWIKNYPDEYKNSQMQPANPNPKK